ncbi:TspO protein [Rhodoblastus sphagnicola]|uniref:TspO protein n=2 Tax=Rhodoblastus sphagnicola TaxID=333368 RepID=A0A2S6NCG9_9HYPH|nr:TspO protein [Rhodoblastus sphagnicola]
MQTFWAHVVEIAVAAGAVVFVAVIGGATTDTGPWYQRLRFPALKPPDWAFGPGWSLIFALIATAGVIAWNDAPDAATRAGLIEILAVNALLNLAWSPLYFKLRRPDWALIELVPFWASILALIFYCGGFSPRAAWLLCPYLAWVSFAGWLNWQVVRLNAPFAGKAAG